MRVLLLVLLAAGGAHAEGPGCYSMVSHTCDCDVDCNACTGTWVTSGCADCSADNGDSCTFDDIVGYTPATDVRSHNSIDGDQKAIENALAS